MASVELPWAWHLNRANTSWHYKNRGRKCAMEQKTKNEEKAWKHFLPIEEKEHVLQQKQEKQKANMQQIQEKEQVLCQRKEKLEANMQQTQKREHVLQEKREKHEATIQQIEKQEQALLQRKEKQEANMRQTQEKEEVLQQKREKQNLTPQQIEKEQVLQQRREKQEANIQQIEEKEQALQQRREKQEASLHQIEEQEQVVQQRREKQKANLQRIEKQEQALQQRREKNAANLQKMQTKEQALQQKREKKQANCYGVFKNAARVSPEADMREFEEKERVLQQKREEQEVNMRQIEEREQALHERACALQKEEHELMQKFKELQDQKGELEKNMRELREQLYEKELLEGKTAVKKFPIAEDQETLQSELQDLKSVVLQLQQTVAQITSDEDEASGSDSSGTSSGTSDSWIVVGSEKPCCFLPDTHFNVLTDVGPVLAPASLLHQGARVQAANGRVVEVVNPPEQHQVDSVIELKAGDGSLIVSPDHRILVPGNKTVKAGDLSKGDEVVLDGMPARLSSCEQKSGPALVLRIGFKPDLPVAAVMPPSSILSKGFRRKPLRRGLKKKQPWDDVLTLPDTEGHLTD